MGLAGMMGSLRSFGRDASVLKQKVRPGTAKRVLQFAGPYAPLLALFLLVVVVDSAAGIANPLIYREIINKGILGSNPKLVAILAISAGSLGLLDAALGFAQAYLSAQTGAKVVLSLRVKLFDHIQRMPLAFFTRARTGALASRLNTDVTGAQNAFTDILSNVIGNGITVLLILIAMFILCWQITLLAVVLLPLFLIPARFWGRKIQQITRESYEVTGAMNNLMVERFNVAGAQLAKLFGQREEESSTFEGQAKRVSDITVTRAVYGRLFATALMLIAYSATAVVYGWGGILAARHALDVGAVVAYVSYLARLYGPLAGLSNIQVSIMTALVSFERVFEVLDLPPMIQEKIGAVDIPAGPASISFKNVAFAYPTASEVFLTSLESLAEPDNTPSRNVLHDITFEAQPGQLVALVGPSGAGKTTITQLIPRLYDVTGGAVSVNGINVRDARLESLYCRIGIVTQEAHLFHDTIRGNLRYAKRDANDEELFEALRAAQILPLIRSLPEGLDTLVGERGYRFSGGEKQRLAIARLLLKAPDIAILDEATAHLDSESELAIQKAFETALRGRTSIVIAHRLSTIIRADQILVVQEGRIVERGRHPELLKQNGLYAELYRLQFAAEALSLN
jgi:ATP-binding cassette, subfamily B, bacterial